MNYSRSIGRGAVLLVVATLLLWAVTAGPLGAQDRERPRPQGPTIQQPNRAADGQTQGNHSVELSGMELPADTRLTSPIRVGYAQTVDPTGSARRRARLERGHLTIGGAWAGQADMIEDFESRPGRHHEMTITFLSPTGEHQGTYEGNAMVTGVTVDLELGTWEMDLFLEQPEQ